MFDTRTRTIFSGFWHPPDYSILLKRFEQRLIKEEIGRENGVLWFMCVPVWARACNDLHTRDFPSILPADREFLHRKKDGLKLFTKRAKKRDTWRKSQESTKWAKTCTYIVVRAISHKVRSINHKSNCPHTVSSTWTFSFILSCLCKISDWGLAAHARVGPAALCGQNLFIYVFLWWLLRWEWRFGPDLFMTQQKIH